MTPLTLLSLAPSLLTPHLRISLRSGYQCPIRAQRYANVKRLCMCPTFCGWFPALGLGLGRARVPHLLLQVQATKTRPEVSEKKEEAEVGTTSHHPGGHYRRL